MSERAVYTTVIDAGTLHDHLFDHNWCVVDVRHDLADRTAGPRAYAAEHIPGAVFAHIDDDLSGTKSGSNGRHPLPRREDLVQRFRDWGIDNDTQIIAYDANGGQFAARLWWLARWLGHRGVALLDGGWQAWMAKINWSSIEPPERPPGRFVAGASLVELASASEVSSALGRELLLDARVAERYRGEVEPIDPVAGHIPGARNRAWQANLNEDLTFKPAARLRQEFGATLANHLPGETTHYCGSGVTACHHVFAMELAGLPGSRLYAGSWSEWIADPSRPIARGEERT